MARRRMRTTSLTIARQLSLYSAASDRGLHQNRLRIAQMQEQMNTGLRVNRPSDDPSAYAEARRLDDLDRRLAQYERSIGTAQSWSDHSQDLMDDLAERFTQMYERGLRAANDTYTAEGREMEASYLEDMLDGIVTLLNEREGDDYLFAGTNTTEPPFAWNSGAVTYNGNSNARAFQVGEDLRINVSLSGDRIQDTGAGFTIFESVQGLADALRSGDATQIETALGQMGTARDHVIEVAAETGSIGNRLQTAELQLQQATLRVAGRRSELQDADLASTILEYQEAQTGLQAALKVTASALQTSLLDYLR